MKELMNEWMKGRINEWTNEGKNEWTNEWTNERQNEWMNQIRTMVGVSYDERERKKNELVTFKLRIKDRSENMIFYI